MRVFTRVVKLRTMVNLHDSTICLNNSPLELSQGKPAHLFMPLEDFSPKRKGFIDIQKSADVKINDFISARMK